MKHNDVKEFFQKNAITISLQLVGVLIVFINLWITTQLSPFAYDISTLKKSVQAIDNRLQEEEAVFADFVVIKTTVNEIDMKLDKLDQRFFDYIQKGK